MLKATRDKLLPTTITGSYPRPRWFTETLHGQAFKDALGDAVFREQYPEVPVPAADPRYTFAG